MIRTLTDLREVYNPEEDEEEQTYEDDEDGEQQLIEAEAEEIPVQIPVEQLQRFGSPERPPNAETGWGDNSSNGSGGWQEEIQAADFSNFNTPELVKHSYKMIIFCSMKLTVDDVYSKLSQEPSIRKYTCKMHGDIDQQFRDAALRDFKEWKYILNFQKRLLIILKLKSEKKVKNVKIRFLFHDMITGKNRQ